MATRKWYRHEKTGVVAFYHPRVADAHSYLIEVPEGTKPLAYTPIPHEAVEEYLASREPVSDEDALLDDEVEEEDLG